MLLTDLYISGDTLARLKSWWSPWTTNRWIKLAVDWQTPARSTSSVVFVKFCVFWAAVTLSKFLGRPVLAALVPVRGQGQLMIAGFPLPPPWENGPLS